MGAQGSGSVAGNAEEQGRGVMHFAEVCDGAGIDGIYRGDSRVGAARGATNCCQRGDHRRVTTCQRVGGSCLGEREGCNAKGVYGD